MDATVINSIVGIIGIVVGIIGIFVGVIGWESLQASQKGIVRANNSTVYQNINNGMTYKDVNDVVENSINSNKGINSIKKLQEILDKDDRFYIPVSWYGKKVEYEELKINGRIEDSVAYFIIDE